MPLPIPSSSLRSTRCSSPSSALPLTPVAPSADRRQFLSTVLTTAVASLSALALTDRDAQAASAVTSASDALALLERRHGGRLGVAMVDLGGGPGLAWRADERFSLCSTFKLMLAACTLAQIDAGRWRADQRLTWTAADAVPHMPIAEGADPARGLSVLTLAEAGQTLSDNLAANLLLRQLGGPQAFTQWLRTQGDAVTRIDHEEPAMNRGNPDTAKTEADWANTTTPVAMAANLERVLRGPMLGDASRERLLGWMRATRTGPRRLRAGLPKGWQIGHKTGTGFDASMPDKINDIAIFWPPGGRAPRLVAAYYEGPLRGSRDIRPQDEAVLAAVGRLAAA